MMHKLTIPAITVFLDSENFELCGKMAAQRKESRLHFIRGLLEEANFVSVELAAALARAKQIGLDRAASKN